MIETLLKEITEQYNLRNASYYLYPSTHRDLITVIFKSNRQTVCVVKYGREKRYNSRIKESHENLDEIRSKLQGTPQRSTIPEPVYTSSINGIKYLVETPVQGKQGSKFTTKNEIIHLLDSARKWLLSVYHRTATEDAESEFEELVTNTSETSLDTPQITGTMHGDFVMSNVLIPYSGGLNVIDWDESSTSGLPIIDFISLITDIPYRLSMSDGVSVFEKTFYFENWYSNLVKREVFNYCSEMDIEQDIVRDYIPIWLSYAQEIGDRHIRTESYTMFKNIQQAYRPERVIW